MVKKSGGGVERVIMVVLQGAMVDLESINLKGGDEYEKGVGRIKEIEGEWINAVAKTQHTEHSVRRHIYGMSLLTFFPTVIEIAALTAFDSVLIDGARSRRPPRSPPLPLRTRRRLLRPEQRLLSSLWPAKSWMRALDVVVGLGVTAIVGEELG
ncbi:hypothetical protein PIB30_064775 [Stylosanthes scabra]|uniref:Uncharacterized protein n=1 Tax=Stylosanthes scabra TaxID=79078 RepID=A0ABU6RMY0_9FABA|nr:hypothetical protein [Stylosanthes scabra]